MLQIWFTLLRLRYVYTRVTVDLVGLRTRYVAFTVTFADFTRTRTLHFGRADLQLRARTHAHTRALHTNCTFAQLAHALVTFTFAVTFADLFVATFWLRVCGYGLPDYGYVAVARCQLRALRTFCLDVSSYADLVTHAVTPFPTLHTRLRYTRFTLHTRVASYVTHTRVYAHPAHAFAFTVRPHHRCSLRFGLIGRV